LTKRSEKEGQMRPMKLIVAAAMAVALGATGCTVEAGPALQIVAKDFAFEGVPPTIQGGPVKVSFRNEGKVEHELAFVDIGDASFEDFRREFPKIFEGGPFPNFFGVGAVPFELGPGDEKTSSFTLPSGKYMLFCGLAGDPTKPKTPDGQEAEGRPHYELGMVIPEVAVNGGSTEVSAPDGEIVARDYTFDVPPLTKGRKQLVFRNAGPKQWHHMVALEYHFTVSEEQALNAFRASLAPPDETAQPPPNTPQPTENGFGGIFSPGGAQTLVMEIQRGYTYLLACFIQDVSGGPPHAVANNMIKTFKGR
jgi:hypothetical protein